MTTERQTTTQVLLTPWADDDLPLLRHANAPEMTDHLGGPETEEQVLGRHLRYLGLPGKGTGRMFRVTLLPDRVAVGIIGYWENTWNGEPVYETGWGVLPQYQGRGIASAAAVAVAARARAEGSRRYLHAFPSVDHLASNAICRKAGFTLVSECEFEYPMGHLLRSNDWCLDLTRPTS